MGNLCRGVLIELPPNSVIQYTFSDLGPGGPAVTLIQENDTIARYSYMPLDTALGRYVYKKMPGRTRHQWTDRMHFLVLKNATLDKLILNNSTTFQITVIHHQDIVYNYQ